MLKGKKFDAFALFCLRKISVPYHGMYVPNFGMAIPYHGMAVPYHGTEIFIVI